jgi:2-polyprenyl-3-methyl-5-hydroxy-6-metoxy-1,4-benzoquinol methylase
MLNASGASWKSRLYNSYVSSGQAATIMKEHPEEMFRPRKAFLTHIISKYLPANRDAEIVDLGCGHGAFIYFLTQAGYKNVSGIDVSPEQIELAHRLGIAGVHLGHISDILGEVKDSSVDVILATDVLEHLTKDELFHTLDEIRRVLKRHGMCIAHVPNAEGLYGMRVRYGDMRLEQAFTPSSAR